MVSFLQEHCIQYLVSDTLAAYNFTVLVTTIKGFILQAHGQFFLQEHWIQFLAEE
jgi:hypothetical protein